MSTFLLVHGGMVGGWYWKKVRHYMGSKNHRIFTPTLTGLGERKHLISPAIDLDVHITDIVNTICYENLEDVILIGHSYAGMIITGVADLVPERIKHLVYIDALIPQDGESMFDIVDPNISSYLLHRAQEEGDGWQVPPNPIESYDFDNPEDIQWIAAHSTAQPLKSFQQPISLKNSLESFTRYYIHCAKASFLDSMLMRAKDMGFICNSLDSGHFPMVTEPEKLSHLLLLANQ